MTPRIEGYRIEERIATGGTSYVYRAVELSSGREVAVKMLQPHVALQDELVQRLVREAEASTRLDHPNVVTCLGVGQVEGVPYVILEYLPGSLRDLVRRVRRLPPAVAAYVAVGVLRGLERAHERDLIHRDIKPANIMLTADGVPRVADFGLSTAAGSVRLTHEGRLLGTPAYMSPEQVGRRELGPASDLFSFGVVLYEMLAGQNPYATEHPATTLDSITGRHPPPLGVLLSDVPQELDELVESLLAKRVQERCASASEALERLAAQEDETQEAGRAGLRELLTDVEAASRRQATERAGRLVGSAREAEAAGARRAALLYLEEALACDRGYEPARQLRREWSREESGQPWRSERCQELVHEAERDPRNVRALLNLTRQSHAEGDAVGSLRAYLWARRRSPSDPFTLGPLVSIVGAADGAFLESISREELERRALTSGSASKEIETVGPGWRRLAPGLILLSLALLAFLLGPSVTRPPGPGQGDHGPIGIERPWDEAGIYLTRASEAFEGEDFARALSICQAYERRFREDPRRHEALLLAALTLSRLGRTAEAHRAYDRLFEAEPPVSIEALARLRRARLYVTAGDWLGAQAMLERVPDPLDDARARAVLRSLESVLPPDAEAAERVRREVLRLGGQSLEEHGEP